MDYYNGYSPAERYKKLRASYKIYPSHSHPYYQGHCHLCGDPKSKVEPHSEDYSEPFLWERPAEYAVCMTCHSRLHKRFKNPHGWAAYKFHIKRGGYGADLKTAKVAAEVRLLGAAIERGETFTLDPIRPFTMTDLWWDKLTVDPESLTAAWARPR